MKRRIQIIFITFVSIMIVCLVGFTYGFYRVLINSNTNGQSIAVEANVLSVVYKDGTSTMNFEGDYFFPGDSVVKEFSVENTGDVITTYNILIDNVVNDFERIQDLRYEIYVNNNLLSDGAINNNQTQYLYTKKSIDKGAIDKIKLIFTYSTTDEIQNVDMNKGISFRINIDSKPINNISIDTRSINFLADRNIVLNNYRIYGNSVQDGTPTPEAPVEVESVGDKTKNLVDVKNGLVYHNNAYIPSYTWERTKTGFKAKFIIEREGTTAHRHGFYIGTTKELAGKTITLSYGEYIGTAPEPTIGIFKTSVVGASAKNSEELTSYQNGYIGANGSSQGVELTTNKSLTYTIPEINDYEYLFVGFYLNYGSKTTQIGDTIEYKNIQVEINDTATKYEPYGYKIPVKVSGKNLFDISKINNFKYNEETKLWERKTQGAFYQSILTGEGSYKGTRDITKLIKLPKGKSATISIYDLSHSAADTTKTIRSFDAALYDEEGDFIKSYSTPLQKSGEKIDAILTFEAQNEDVWIDMRTSDRDYTPFYLSRIQVEYNSEKTPYEPYVEPITTNIYLNEPLRKIGAYVDYIDFKQQHVVRRVGVQAFTGTETLETPGIGSYLYRYSYKMSDMANLYNEATLVSNYFPGGTYLDVSESETPIVGIETPSSISFASAYATVNEFKSWLASVYNADNPVYVYYPKLEEERKPLKLPNIEMNSGTNYITVDTSVESRVDLEY